MIYGNGHKATDDVSFNIKAGEIVGFAGPNGAGKTTVIKMLTGILKPTSGNVVINGFNIDKDPINAKMSFAYIADNPDIPAFEDFPDLLAAIKAVPDSN